MAQMQQFGIIEKLPTTAAPEPVKAKVEEVQPPVAKAEIKEENQEWKTQFNKAPVGSYELEIGTSLKLDQTAEQKLVAAQDKLGSFLS